MKRIALVSLLALFLFALASEGAATEQRGIRIVSKSGENLHPCKDYHALVVGVSNYEKWPHLPNGVKDAKEVAERLEGLGFRVKLVTNPTHQEMNAALDYLSNGSDKISSIVKHTLEDGIRCARSGEMLLLHRILPS